MQAPFTDRATPLELASTHRRAVMLAIGGLALAATFGDVRLPSAFAAPVAPVADTLAQFMALSSWLTGRPSLNRELGRRYLDALTAQVSGFATQLAALDALRLAQPGQSQQAYCDAVDASGAAYAQLPRGILAAWYTGQVGVLPAPASQHDRSSPPQPDAKATVVAYEMALMYAVTADTLAIPSYCRDVPGYWARQPQGAAA